MSVYKVERRVDTVIVEMDVDVAERLVAILDKVRDKTPAARYSGSSIGTLFNRLIDDADVRWPSRMYEVRESNIDLYNTPETGG